MIGVFLLLYMIFCLNVLENHYQKYAGSLTASIFFFSACFLASIQEGKHNPIHVANQNFNSGIIVGKIISNPKINKKVQLQIAISKTAIGMKERQSVGKCLAFLKVNEDTKKLGYGDIIQLQASLDTIASSKNASGFDFKKFYANKGITHRANVKDWKLLERNTGLYATILSYREKLLIVLRQHLKTDNEYAVGAALCLGTKDYLTDELKNKFATVGAMHVLAVSGLHVGIIFSMLFKLLNVFKTRKKHWVFLKIIITLAGIWLFAFLTGGSPSVLRAGIMFSFITVSIYIRRFKNTYNTLAAAAMLLLVYDPYLLFDVGFQLSFTAVAGIVYLHPKIYSLLYFRWKGTDYLWQITSVGIVAQIATFPIGLYYFQHLPVNFLFTGLFVVPFAFIILSLGIGLFIVQLFSSTLAVGIGYLLYGAIWLNNALINLVFLLPTNDYGHFYLGGLGLVLIYVLLLSTDRFFTSAKASFVILTLGVVLISLIII